MHDAIVIGGGLAGCAMAIRLARGGFDVLLLESATYPVHKLCGEFLSPEVQGLFRDLGVSDAIASANPAPVRRVVVTGRHGGVWSADLPGQALGLSRWTLDPIMFEAAVGAGARGIMAADVRSIEGSIADGFLVSGDRNGVPFEYRSRLVVGAFGKRSRLDRRLQRDADRKPSEFVAFKMHYRGADVGDRVELHAFDGGYCGLSHVEDGRLNACLIARVAALRGAGRSFEALRDGPMRANPRLARLFERMEPLYDRPVASAGMTFRSRRTFDRDVMMVGDTAAMIAPLCGDGMAMALSAAEIAAPVAAAYLVGALDGESMRGMYARRWRSAFRVRLAAGRVLQAALFRPRVADAGLGILNRAPGLGALLVRLTREPGRA